jgi:hypothetical protein
MLVCDGITEVCMISFIARYPMSTSYKLRPTNYILQTLNLRFDMFSPEKKQTKLVYTFKIAIVVDQKEIAKNDCLANCYL